jgi:predicted Zn-dependent protease
MSGWTGLLAQALPACDGWSARRVSQRLARLRVRSGVLDPPEHLDESGILLTVHAHGGAGHAATADMSLGGLRRAGQQAVELARLAGRNRSCPPLPFHGASRGTFRALARQHWTGLPMGSKIDLLQSVAPAFDAPEIVDWFSSFEHVQSTVELATSQGTLVVQELATLLPSLLAMGSNGQDVVLRSFGRQGARQAGLEMFQDLDWPAEASRLVHEIRELLSAPLCPTRTMDLLVAPDQMVMQIHESIGHALELDRMLGDERNNAGSTFVTPEMVGSFRYGSDLLNVSFDPSDPAQAAAYGWDDEGTPAEREPVIRDGILVRALGGASSQARAGVPGVACSRASSWWRTPIDRMANLNLEPGRQSMEELISSIDKGIFLETNLSFSIDDRRESFQFATERGRLIEGGRLTSVVRKPGYRGRTVPFWRSLAGVGDGGTYHAHGTPYCGKGEPQQRILASHGSPACLFAGVEVFGAP